MSWDFIYNLIIALATISLLSVGVYLAWYGRSHAQLVLIFAFLFAVLLVCSRFKHVKGFGFEAEMWDQKQIEAAKLIDRLTLLSETTAQQIVLIATRVGFYGETLTIRQLSSLLVQIEKILAAVETPKSKRNEITAPIINRIKMNYVLVAQRTAQEAYARTLENIYKSIGTASSKDDRESLIAKSIQMREVIHKIDNIPFKPMLEANNLNPLLEVVRASPKWENQEKLIETLSEYSEDLQFFTINLQLRRNIDF